MRILTLKIKIMFESNPLKSITIVRRLAVKGETCLFLGTCAAVARRPNPLKKKTTHTEVHHFDGSTQMHCLSENSTFVVTPSVLTPFVRC